MPFGQLVEILDGMLPSPWNIVLRWVLAVGGVLFLLIKTVKFVPQGQRAMRTRFGKVVYRNGKPIYLEPGMHILFPVAHNLERVGVLDRTIELPPTRLRYGAFNVVDVTATVTFGAVDIYLIRYAVENLEERLAAACLARLRQVLQAVPDGAIDRSVASIDAEFNEIIAPIASELGLSLKGLDIVNVAPDAQFAIASAIQHHSQ